MAGNPNSQVSVDPGERIAALHRRGLIGRESEQAYRALFSSIYAPRLAAVGFDPKFGVYAKEDPQAQQLRQQLVEFLALEAQDPALRARLKAAADKWLGGDKEALDPGFRATALSVLASDGGLPAAKMLVDRALLSEDQTVREAALGAAATTGRRDVADYLLNLTDKRMRSYDRLGLIFGLAGTAGTRDMTGEWIFRNYDKLASGNGIFISSRLPGALSSQCGIEQASRIDAVLGPAVRKADVGLLSFQRTVESVRNCGILKQAKAAEIAAALKAS